MGFATIRRASLVAASVLAASCSAAPPAGATGSRGSAAGSSFPEDDPRFALVRFLDAAQARDFAGVWALLAGPLRARYTPERLAQDFDRVEGSARERLSRARQAVAADLFVDGEVAELSVGADRAVRLVRERAAWKVAALE